MNIRCPSCETGYAVDPQLLRPSAGQVRCANCGQVFLAEQHQADNSDGSFLIEEDSDLGPDFDPFADDTAAPELDLDLGFEVEAEQQATELPFDLPDNLPKLQPSGDAALDMQHALAHRPPPAPLWQKLLLLVLVLLALLQLTWAARAHWLLLPQFQGACDWLDCSIVQPRDPVAFKVVERQLLADNLMDNALRLRLRFRNEATYSQPLPRLQLSLFDNNGTIIARRLFQPDEYLFPAPAGSAQASAQEVFTIELLFEDPGARASGFKIHFL